MMQERGASQQPSSRRKLLRELRVTRLSPPALGVDANDDVIELMGDVSPWCWVAPGPANMSLVSVVREELHAAVQALLIQVRHMGADERACSVLTPRGDARLELRCLDPERTDWVLLTFNPVSVGSPVTASARQRVSLVKAGGAEGESEIPESTEANLRQVEAELDETRSALQATADDLSPSRNCGQ